MHLLQRRRREKYGQNRRRRPGYQAGKDDEVVAMELVEPGQELLVVTENGYGKRTPVKDYKIQVRGGKGLLTYDKAKFKKTGALIGAMVVDEDDEVL